LPQIKKYQKKLQKLGKDADPNLDKKDFLDPDKESIG
jgi:hypothetical protein